MPVRRRLLSLVTVLAIAVPVIRVDARTQSSAQSFQPTRFTVVDEGTRGKPDIVLVPGLTSSRKVWANEAARLAPNYRLHLIQVNGFGDQPAGMNAADEALLPHIVDQLHQYIVAKHMHPVVVGHSLGGLLTLMLARKYPNDVAKIVIVDALPFYGLIFGPQASVESVRPTAIAMRDGAIRQTQAQRELAEQRTAETLVLNPEGRALVAADGLASDPHVFAQAMYEDFQTDLRSELSSITTPALILYAFDPTLTFPNGVKPTQEMADSITSAAYKSMPNARLVRVDNSRHFIMFDQPDRLDGLLRGFLVGRRDDLR